jgi:hypothetical protein
MLTLCIAIHRPKRLPLYPSIVFVGIAPCSPAVLDKDASYFRKLSVKTTLTVEECALVFAQSLLLSK